jgi:hypothetical protein
VVEEATYFMEAKRGSKKRKRRGWDPNIPFENMPPMT